MAAAVDMVVGSASTVGAMAGAAARLADRTFAGMTIPDARDVTDTDSPNKDG